MQSLDNKSERTLIGRRVVLVKTTDEYTNLVPGAEGTVIYVDDLDTVFVHWDDGSSLGLIPGEDNWTYLS